MSETKVDKNSHTTTASEPKSADFSLASDVNKLLAEALEGKSEAFKHRVMDFALSCGLSQDDPLFLMLIATGRLEAMLEDAPDTLQALFKHWNQDLARTLELVESVTVERQKVAIERSAYALIHKTLLQEGKNILTSVTPATILLLLILGFGFIMGMIVPTWITSPILGMLGGGYTQVQSTSLTWKELEALKWATSKEGKFAKDLIDWNKGYLDNGDCIKDTQRLGVVLSYYGRKGKSGHCLIWAVPPEKRKFVD
ncbi:MAG: hypothetical protein KME28_00865 [Pelatocladus maniniholoensis HA4357-MV3]|jgi:hypothetical protein|uniref:Uncharacterized protein n=1 Tax=Pelatocladus maniniholoensis HA4357-MV3 TaxID=1117104 RepID=A0A9E3H4G9_9NOST|nr:hypothetical protein [Pelatocladus maniniholoensis HA4357-MV3]